MDCLSQMLRTGEPFTLMADNLDETQAIGRELGALAVPGTVILLSGDLGSGKTSFVQGLARGLGVPEDYYVTSPSYTLVNEYPGRLPLYHLDLYRLSESDDLWDIGIEDILSAQGVVAIEWPDRLPEGVIGGHIRIDISIGKGDARRFDFIISGLDLNSEI